MVKWKYGINSLQIFSKLQIFIHQKDQFGNLVPGFYPFDAQVVQKTTGLSVPVADLFFQDIEYGVQMLSFVVSEPGDFLLTIFNSKLNESISNLAYKVFIGVVDTSKSKVLNLKSEVKQLGNNGVLVELVDSYWNHVPSQEENLNLQLQGPNSSMLLKTAFVESKDGLYTGYYLSKNPGTYNICISFGEMILYPCPIMVHLHERNYFPEANNDSVSVWEDESVVFDILSNDYASDGQVSLMKFSKTLHGSLLQWGKLFRYTPFKGYFGNDSFSYIITDSNNNVVVGYTFISILCRPPQFISLPVLLNVTEDVLSPQFGGFPGFEIIYSDNFENLSLSMSAKSGSIYLAPIRIDISEPVDGMHSIKRGGRAGKDLIVEGPIEVINSALQLIQYLSNENFYGDDTISLYATNKNGLQDSHVPVFVKPINDPPKIHAPKFIMLHGNEASNGFQIYDKHKDTFEFSVTDSDIFHYAGNRSHLMFTFSVEVNDGLLSTTLPVHLIKTTELKIKNSNQWQPLQTFVTIANQFIPKGRGIRFQGTIEDCNNAMQHLFFLGANLDSLLTITVNDMGNYGRYSDCTDIMSVPLSTEANVILIKRRPLNSTTALLLGSAIFFEIAMLFLLGALLLFFICKCMTTLHSEGKNRDDTTNNTTEQLFNNQNEKGLGSAPEAGDGIDLPRSQAEVCIS